MAGKGREEENTSRSHRAVNVLGVRVSDWTVPALIDAMVGWAKAPGAESTVHYANAHVLNVAYDNESLRNQLNRASTVYCDGSGVRLGAWLLGQGLSPRLTAADWIGDFCERAAREHLSLFLLGGVEGVAERAAVILRQNHQGLNIVGSHHGYVEGPESDHIIEQMNRAGPDIVIVGMGTPKQELWIAQHRHQINVPVVWSVGALFDFIAGVQKRSPRWLTERHLEWLGRLLSDPIRLSGRYLIGNPLFGLRVIRQRLLGLPSGIAEAVL